MIVSQPISDIPVFIVRNTKTDQEKTLHRNLLLPLGYRFYVDIPGEEDEDIFIQPLFELVEEIEAQPSPSVNTAPKVAFLDQPEVLGETRSSLKSGSGISSEKDSTKIPGLSDSVGGSGADCGDPTKSGGTDSGASPQSSTKSLGSGADTDVSTKSGGTGSGVSSLSSTKSSSSDISQPRGSGVSCEENTKSCLSLDASPQEGNTSFLNDNSNKESFNLDPPYLLEVFEPSTSMIVDETTSSNGPISDTTASSDDSARPEGLPIALEESVDSEEDSPSEEEFLLNQESHAFYQLLLDLISSCKSFCINVHMFLAILVRKNTKRCLY